MMLQFKSHCPRVLPLSMWLTFPPTAAAKLHQSCPTLCDLIDGSPPGSSVPGILQERILEGVAISFSNACMHAKSLQSCPTLCNPLDSSSPGSSVHRILQVRIMLLGILIYSKKMKSLSQKNICTSVFIAALLRIAKT